MSVFKDSYFDILLSWFACALVPASSVSIAVLLVAIVIHRFID